MTINQLPWRVLIPETDSWQSVFDAPLPATRTEDAFETVQARLCYGLQQFCHPWGYSRTLLLRAPEDSETLALITDAVRRTHVPGATQYGGHYLIDGNTVTFTAAGGRAGDFTATGEVVTAEWIENDQLFGCVRQHNQGITLQPGLLHKANGGVLILSMRSVLAQPLLWLRLKEMVTRQRFEWLSPDETRPLPLSIPGMPLDVKLILTGDREAMADFQETEPELAESAIYCEFEETLSLEQEDARTAWTGWISAIAGQQKLPLPLKDAWPLLLREAVRYSGDQSILPLSPGWIQRQLKEVAIISNGDPFSAEQFRTMLDQREWRENYLAGRMQDEILQEQILIETEGEQVGQINALSVIEFPGHPRAFGEPSRISCVVHIGDGEFTDVERKAELGGNIHAKGMMIMQAFLMSELQLEQQIPFSASITFEQSYSEVDGDSASLAELCALISALADVPIRQHLAITGSVDQFGRVQPVGGLNEKIEGFFRICEQRGFTGDQGVIIPTANVQHLSLHQDILDAVESGTFSLWGVDSVEDALPLLTNVIWDGEGRPSLLQAISERIAQASQQEGRNRYPWPLRWLNWFNHN
ncbi:AAA family ATPase [Shimwellia blattae]|uniref:endopeptidase La n=1 Tax=Shimwellia blattae (strain ATCC 29907 / DSM 4481 / JCM 1650 / NBRC 105725 / CDC 9005-74) TaxID=630626 RepID=I2BAL0_SHIBC|nr:Lon protease family protein [Shimwellia blattae]AFJ47564.1 putative protease La-like protein [Shimwellia blattae DSM 4481 = NBRC 105725]GAB79859.1 putative Lon protease homolog YcbZ [Shimwellia blattae DSM 4481 = NBRC 105725]